MIENKLEEKLVCLEMDDASGRDKRNGRWAKLEDWKYYYDFLKEIGAFVTIAIEPEKASEEVMRFLAKHPDVFLPTVHGTVKYGHYGGIKTKERVKEQWEWTVNEIKKFGFDIGPDGNGIFIPPMHMISDTAIDALKECGVKVIGSDTSNFPLGSKETRNNKGELVYILNENVEAYRNYRGVYFYRRFRPWVLRAGFYKKEEILGLAKQSSSSNAKYVCTDYNRYLDLCAQDFEKYCLGKNSVFYAHEINLGGERPFIDILKNIAKKGLFDNVRFVDAKQIVSKYLNDSSKLSV